MRSSSIERKREIAFSLDLLLPGFYAWMPWLSWYLGGNIPDDKSYRYSGKIQTSWGAAIVLPGYKILKTDKRPLRLDQHVLNCADSWDIKVEPTHLFEDLIKKIGYTEVEAIKMKERRLKVLWTHPQHRRIEAVYSENRGLFLTAYHPN